MNSFAKSIQASPALARALPFFIFAGLTSLQGVFGDESRYWIYLLKTCAGIGLLWWVRPWVSEMKWAFSWEAVAVGVGVFILWVGLDGFYPKLGSAGAVWNPQAAFGDHSGLATLFIAVRILGATLVVPPLEEVFYRSLAYRWLQQADFLTIPLGKFLTKPFLITAILFGFSHYEWLAGILCGLLYQGLVCWKKRLGDAMTAHAITNCLLGIWVIWRGAWNFW